jgi:predicted MPP superfamily phosphohydrolase
MTLVVSMLMAPPVLYLSFRYYYLNKQYSQSAWKRYALPVIVFPFYLFPVSAAIDFYATGGIDVLKYPKPLSYWFWFGLVFVYQLATWLLIGDVLKQIARLLPVDGPTLSRFYRLFAVALFGVLFLFNGWKVYHDTTAIQIEEVALEVADLPNSLEGFKLLHITDIQGDEYTGREEIAQYVNKVNAQDGDLIVFTGDLISYGTDFIKMSAEELGKANARLGTIAVVGDHDYWAGTENVREALNREGIPLLQDENHILQADSSTALALTGVTEVYSKSADPAVVDSLTGSGRNAALKIFASHQVKQRLVTKAQENSYDIMLGGHTHGGQIFVPFLGMGFSASERETKYVSGLYQEGQLPININNGLGFTLAPIRYDAPPNISVITFESK